MHSKAFLEPMIGQAWCPAGQNGIERLRRPEAGEVLGIHFVWSELGTRPLEHLVQVSEGGEVEMVPEPQLA